MQRLDNRIIITMKMMIVIIIVRLQNSNILLTQITATAELRRNQTISVRTIKNNLFANA